jgi:hypothetical protein
VTREVTFEGEGCRLTLGVLRYEFDDDVRGAEANWLAGGVKLELSATGAFRCSVPVLFRANELSSFRGELGRVLGQQKGAAALDTEEDRVFISVVLGRGEPMLAGYVHVEGFASLDFHNIVTDEVSLRHTHGQLVELVREFPQRASV